MSFGISLSGSKSTSKNKSTSDNTFDPVSLGLFQQPFTSAMDQLKGVSNTPYGGSLGAGLDPQQIQAAQMAQQNAGRGQAQVGAASDIAQSVSGYRPGDVTAGSRAGMDLSGYMNPQVDAILNRGLDKLDEFRRRSLVGNEQAAGPGAWGGARHGVADSLTNENFMGQASDFTNSVLSGAYDNAMTWAGQDQGNALQANLANQSAGLQGAGLNLSAANALNNFGQTANQMGANDANLINSFGQQAQATQENANNMAYAEWLRQQGLPMELAQAYAGLAGQVPILVDNKSTGKTTQSGYGATAASGRYGDKG